MKRKFSIKKNTKSQFENSYTLLSQGKKVADIGSRSTGLFKEFKATVNKNTYSVVFLLRFDIVANKGEGEVYRIDEPGVTNCNFWQSPKLSDHKVIIATGQKAIDEVWDTYKSYNITHI